METIITSGPMICIPHGAPFHPPSRDCPYCEVSRLSALIKRAGDLLTYGGPDPELHSTAGADAWIDRCDEWFKDADYGQPRPAVSASDEAIGLANHLTSNK